MRKIIREKIEAARAGKTKKKPMKRYYVSPYGKMWREKVYEMVRNRIA